NPEDSFDTLSAAVDRLSAETKRGAVREPGEEGFINADLAARLGMGGAGAVLPSLMKAGEVPGAVVKSSSFTAKDRTSIPRAGQIAQADLRSMPKLTDDVQSAADQLARQYGGFTEQRRGVQSVTRTEALSERVPVKTDAPVTPGTAMNAE